MSAALGLFRLQQVDSRISNIETRLAKIREIMENDSEIQAASEMVKIAETKQHEFVALRQSLEQDARDKKIKIQHAESSLYGGTVQNPKELLDLQADVTSLKKHLTVIEEQELEVMIKVESAEAEIKVVLENLSKVQDRLDGANQELISEKESLSRDLANLHVERNATIDHVEARFLKSYEILHQQRRGIAVAEVIENACRACGTTLNAAMQQNARHAADLVFCPSCGRILYAS